MVDLPNTAVVSLREMSLDETERLMTLVSGTSDGRSLWSLPEAVQRSAQRPLVAILLAGYLTSRPDSMYPTVGRLVEWIVRQAIDRAGPNMSRTVEALLRALAVRLTDGAAAVPTRLLTASVGAVAELTATRLVNVRSEGLDFALPVLRQWFACASLREGDIAIQDVADSDRLDRWTDVVATAVEFAADEAAPGPPIGPARSK